MLSKTSEYAIRALIFIQAENMAERRPKMTEIALGIGSPTHYTAKILQTLVRHDLLSSAKGRGGGFFFKNGSDPISLYDVIKLLEGESFFHRCGFGLDHCSDEHPCPMHDEYHEIRQNYVDTVSRLTIIDLAKKVDQKIAFLFDEKQ
ncbi:MAG: Rrf2 family transcriptional regulator [Bacteroidales bacterium]|nr:Rrf2 family transcriptional regulator [Bacteroidales bacterium]